MTFAENLMTYALGRRVEAYDMPALRAIVRERRDTELQHPARSSPASRGARRFK